MSDSSHSSVRLALFWPVRPLAGAMMAACVAASCLLLAPSAAAADPPLAVLSVNDVTLVAIVASGAIPLIAALVIRRWWKPAGTADVKEAIASGHSSNV